MMENVFRILLCIIILSCLSFPATAHSGKTDIYGGHNDNRNVSGYGNYHYHCGGYPAHLHQNDKCPYGTDLVSETDKASKIPFSKSTGETDRSTTQCTEKIKCSTNNKEDIIVFATAFFIVVTVTVIHIVKRK